MEKSEVTDCQNLETNKILADMTDINVEVTQTVNVESFPEKQDSSLEDSCVIDTEEFSSVRDTEEFSSDNFKIQLEGLPKHFAVTKLKLLLDKTLELNCHKVKAGGRLKETAFVNFKDEKARLNALNVLDGYVWQKRTLTAKKACPPKDAVRTARLQKEPDVDESLSIEERIKNSVIPYHNVPYNDQLEKKQKAATAIMQKYGNSLAKINGSLSKYIMAQKKQLDGLVCPVENIVPSPITKGYRNKCEFTIGKSKDALKSIIGFRMASYKKGSVEVGPIGHLEHISQKMKDIVTAMERYIEKSPHEPFDQVTHAGVWRQLTIRTSNQGDALLIVTLHPQKFSTDELTAIKTDVIQFFTEGEGKDCAITSIFFQVFGQRESGIELEFVHGWGKTFIEEQVLGRKYRAGPDSFLQVNTPACEEIYKKIIDIAEIDSSSVVLDICCGVGSIGLSVAEKAQNVYGVDITESSIVQAKENMILNSITNAAFYNGKAEDYMGVLLAKACQKKTIAIVDPPRAGLHSSVMGALRKASKLNRLVYVSCDPKAALSNFEALARPRSKTYAGNCFVPIRAIPVDLFPDTPHFELIILFERFDPTSWTADNQGAMLTVKDSPPKESSESSGQTNNTTNNDTTDTTEEQSSSHTEQTQEPSNVDSDTVSETTSDSLLIDSIPEKVEIVVPQEPSNVDSDIVSETTSDNLVIDSIPEKVEIVVPQDSPISEDQADTGMTLEGSSVASPKQETSKNEIPEHKNTENKMSSNVKTVGTKQVRGRENNQPGRNRSIQTNRKGRNHSRPNQTSRFNNTLDRRYSYQRAGYNPSTPVHSNQRYISNPNTPLHSNQRFGSHTQVHSNQRFGSNTQAHSDQRFGSHTQAHSEQRFISNPNTSPHSRQRFGPNTHAHSNQWLSPNHNTQTQSNQRFGFNPNTQANSNQPFESNPNTRAHLNHGFGSNPNTEVHSNQPFEYRGLKRSRQSFENDDWQPRNDQSNNMRSRHDYAGSGSFSHVVNQSQFQGPSRNGPNRSADSWNRRTTSSHQGEANQSYVDGSVYAPNTRYNSYNQTPSVAPFSRESGLYREPKHNSAGFDPTWRREEAAYNPNPENNQQSQDEWW